MKNEETFKPLPIAASRTGLLDGTVVTVGFPDIGLQKFLNHETHELHEKLKTGELGTRGTYPSEVSCVLCISWFESFPLLLAKGEIASLSGAGDDPRYFQISVPVQPGNSGGALVDERGNVIGIVSAKLDAGAALAASGALPENVNYAVKSSLLLSFLESVPDLAPNLKVPNTKDEKFEDVVKSAQDAAVLVLVY